MNILAIDTATEVCSVALLADMNQNTEEIFESGAVQASRVVLAMLEELFRRTGTDWPQIDLLAFGHGPGSFTGVRVATGLVQGLALGREIRVMGVSTLAAIARAAIDTSNRPELPVLAALDARLDEVYWGCYRSAEGHLLQCLAEDTLSRCGDIELPLNGPWLAAGDAQTVHGKKLAETVGSDRLQWVSDVKPRASVIAALAADRASAGEAGCRAEDVTPVYLREKVTQT